MPTLTDYKVEDIWHNLSIKKSSLYVTLPMTCICTSSLGIYFRLRVNINKKIYNPINNLSSHLLHIQIYISNKYPNRICKLFDNL